MNREQKQAAVEELSERLGASDAVFAIDYRGITVPQAAELRARLREVDASFKIVKNRLTKRATEQTGTQLLDEHLAGPTALALIRGDAVVAAKAISEFARTHRVLAYKGGIMDGAALDPDQFKAIARLPGRDVLRGQLVGLAASPLSGLVGTLNALVGGLATQLGQIAERGLLGGHPGEERGAGATDEPEAEAEEPATEETSETEKTDEQEDEESTKED